MFVTGHPNCGPALGTGGPKWRRPIRSRSQTGHSDHPPLTGRELPRPAIFGGLFEMRERTRSFCRRSRRLDSAPTHDNRNLKMKLLYGEFFISASRRWFTRLCHITTMPSYKIDIARHIREMSYAVLVSFTNRLHPKTIFDRS